MTGETKLQAVYGQAVNALNRGAWAEAFGIAEQLLPVAHQHAGVQFIAGVSALGLRRLGPAIAHLQTAVRINPQRADYGAQLSKAWATAGNLRKAHEVAIAAMRLPLQDPLTANTLGVVLTQANDHVRSATAFAAAAEQDQLNPTYQFNLATALTFNGDLEEAGDALEACIALEPRYWKAHLAIAQLTTRTPASNHLPRLEALLRTHLMDDQAQLHLRLAMSRELEDLGRHPEALEHLITGKAVVAKTRCYRWQDDQARFDQLHEVFSNLTAPKVGHDSHEPIFVVGMPRSGTTLVERILSTHPDVHSAGELNNFPLMVRRASKVVSRELLDDAVLAATGDMDWEWLGRSYVESTRPGTGHTARFIDKLPHNFMYVGHILHALPNAKVICLRRDPMDTCLGNFRQLFALESPHYDYSFDMMDVGHYYLIFECLMQGWESLFPGRFLQLQYESLVRDQERTTRELLEYCGLGWDARCLAFHENPAPTATASTAQVREPLHARFQGRWRRYGAGLEPLQRLLAQGLP